MNIYNSILSIYKKKYYVSFILEKIIKRTERLIDKRTSISKVNINTLQINKQIRVIAFNISTLSSVETNLFCDKFIKEKQFVC